MIAHETDQLGHGAVIDDAGMQLLPVAHGEAPAFSGLRGGIEKVSGADSGGKGETTSGFQALPGGLQLGALLPQLQFLGVSLPAGGSAADDPEGEQDR